MSKNHLTEQQTKNFHLTTPSLAEFGYGLGFFCTVNEGGVKSSFGGTGAGGTAYYVNQNLNYSMFYAQHVFTSPFGTTWQKIKNHLNEIFA